MKKNKQFSHNHIKYINAIKKENVTVSILRVALLCIILSLWEILSYFEIIDSFISSSPSKIIKTVKILFVENNLAFHMFVTLYETLLGFVIAVFLGYIIALILWWSNRIRKILEPYIVVLNSLPKIALGPIIIVWCGSGTKAIIFMTVLIGIIIAIITMLNSFLATDKNKILLLTSMGANKFQVLIKLVIPQSIPTFISMLKMSIGMAWIGSIMGEYLVSRAGIGYLIVYGGQVFKLDLVMSATIILCILATIMYLLVAMLEKLVIKYKNQ